MFIPFETLPDTSRIWIYQANRPLQAEELTEIQTFLTTQIDAWGAHGAPLKASFSVIKNQIILIAADESFQAASGCSIDTSSRWMKELGARFSVDFFDRSILCENEGDKLFSVSPFQIKKHVAAGEITEQTRVYTQNIGLKIELANWPQKAGESSWAKYFSSQPI